jgi:hypothetical protein
MAMPIDQWNMCMTGSRACAFKSNFSEVVEIGMGSFGQVYGVTLKGDKLVIKESYLKHEEKKNLKYFTRDNQKWELVSKYAYPRENRVLDLVNQLLLTYKCPNFVYMYNIGVCDG